MNKSSPYILTKRSTPRVMYGVLLCLLPGLLAYIYFVGGYVFVSQLLLLSVLCVGMEMLCLRLRQVRIDQAWDGSAILTAVFLMLCLPPWVDFFVLFVGALFSIVLVKHLYGGLGHNFLNPAMMGYAVLLIAFPDDLSQWPSIGALFDGGMWVAWSDYLNVDALSSATPLAQGRADAIEQGRALVTPVGASNAWMMINLLFGLGGILLLFFRLIDWRIPLALLSAFVVVMLLDVFLLSGLSWGDSVSILFTHVFSGAIFLGAFFIATDPVSASTTPLGRLIYGVMVGALIYVIRSYGHYPDGVAFAVLIANMCVPLIDVYTKPRVYGY